MACQFSTLLAAIAFSAAVVAQDRGVRPMSTGKGDLETIRFKDGTKTFEMQFVKIPGGSFMMGSSKKVLRYVNTRDDVLPGYEEEHQVEVSTFYLGKFHVTRGQFAMFVKDTGYKSDAEKGEGGWGWNVAIQKWGFGKEYNWKNAGFEQTDDHPVVNVSWNDAKMFCAWLSKKGGKKVGLPSEAQWEYACRGGTQTLYHFGDDEVDLVHYANTRDASCRKLAGFEFGIKEDDGYAFTSPVGKFKPNQFGLYDMHGNVRQWCEDYYGKYRDVPKKTDPVQSAEQSGGFRALRGSSWCSTPIFVRAANRYASWPDKCDDKTGFRVVLLP
jgi:formylglycine-generating enzyme required for sulfatase activity